MRLDLTVTNRDVVDLYVNGTYQAHISVSVTDTRDTLESQVRAAHALRRLASYVGELPQVVAAVVAEPDQADPTPAKRLAAFWRGLLAGLAGATGAHPTQPDLPGLPPAPTSALPFFLICVT